MASARIDPRVTYENQSLNMVRADCTDIPRHVLPAGYRFRPYRGGDDLVWTALHQAAEPFFDIAASLFDGQYGARRSALPDRMWFVETDAGEAVASISSWWEHEPPAVDDRGRIHWVVVHPEHQRRGLSKAMMTVAMDRLALSHPAAMLGTSAGRPWAIKVYLDFGFHPDPAQVDAPDVQQGWREVQSIIAHPALANWSQSPESDR